MNNYVIITPARDEEAYIEQTIRSVIHQTITPTEWIIVNDGSTDQTGRIIDEYAKKYTWIQAIHRDNRGFRNSAGGEIDAFYEGYRCLRSNDWDFVVKLDGDLSFADDYFEKCLEHFANDPSLGIGGGAVYNIVNGGEQFEKTPLFHVRGATKIYKRECWNAIGKISKTNGWDTIDEVKANMLGWKTTTFPNLKIIHHRYTGSANGLWRDAIKNGRGAYISGYHPVFMTLRCLRRIFQKPYIVVSIGLFYGFFSSYLKKLPRINDEGLINYLRKQQLNRLFFKETMWK